MFAEDVVTRFAEGTWVTIQLVFMAGALGTVAAIISGLAGLSPLWAIRWVNRVYVEFFRGSSAVILLYWTFYGLPRANPDVDILSLTPMQAGVFALGLNMGAYGSEIVRGAVRAVPRGQYEASIALSIPRFARMRYVIFPQAIVAMLPPYGNLLIEMTKATALVSLITLPEVTWIGYQMRANADLTSAQVFSTLLVIYFCISLALTALVRTAERYAARSMGIRT
ncbi:MAG: ectoine/hydroxyectoine ABC transporter permease subunit EhuC [Dehalococcoidia bacterium]